MCKNTSFNRRKFLKTSAAGVVGTGIIANSPYHLVGQDDKKKKLKIKEYRTLGRTGFKVSDISLGAGNMTNANVLEVALDMGINYIDTAEHYANGQSEKTIGEVLKNRDRKKIFLTTKINLKFGGGDSQEAIRNRSLKCLERLQTDYVDCLMVHMTSSIDQVTHEGFHNAVKELKAEGKVRFVGLSNHGQEHSLAGNTKDAMEKVIIAAANDGRFDVALFVYNFIQKDQGERIIKACKSKNMGVTLMKMNPVNFYLSIKEMFEKREEQGRAPSERAIKMLKEYETMAKKANVFKKKHGLKSNEQVRDAAIMFVLSNPGVHCACPTINNFDELETFVALSGKKLKSTDTSMLRDYKSLLSHYYCRHACGECESACPHRVPVNTIMRYNHYFDTQGREKHAMLKYEKLNTAKANKCEQCSAPCEANCPYEVPVQGLLVNAHKNLTLV